jgi:hypothetical protein
MKGCPAGIPAVEGISNSSLLEEQRNHLVAFTTLLSPGAVDSIRSLDIDAARMSATQKHRAGALPRVSGRTEEHLPPAQLVDEIMKLGVGLAAGPPVRRGLRQAGLKTDVNHHLPVGTGVQAATVDDRVDRNRNG